MHEVKPGQWPLSNNHDPNNSSNRNSQNGGGGDHLVRGEYYFRELFVLRDVAFQPEVDAVVGVPKPEHASLHTPALEPYAFQYDYCNFFW